MRLAPMLGCLALIATVAVGCGDDEKTSGTPDAGSATTAPAAPTDATSDAGGDDSASLPKFCDVITADQIGAAIGATVTAEAGPFDACEFDQEDPRALSGSLGAIDVEPGGGYESYQSGSKGAMDSPTRHDLDGIGDAAFVDIGTMMGGENLQVSGGVLVGHVVYSLVLTQGNGMSEDDLVSISEKLLTLMVDAA